MKNIAKWIILFFITIFLFILILNILKRRGNGFKNRAKQNGFAHGISYKIKNKNALNLILKPKLKPSKAKNEYLKDIFNLHGKKYKKFNRPFVSALKRKNGKINSFSPDLINTGNNAGNLSGFIRKLKFKGFSSNKPPSPSLIFTAGKIALIKIGEKKYYVHSGEKLKGMFILKIGLSDISYSRKGKIKNLNF
ncbi:MAG: hypothetical protein ACYCSQ_03130 [bacterium]